MTTNLRRVFFTLNNWSDHFPSKESVSSHFSSLPHFKGAVIGFEVGESGTPHLQGVIQFTQQKTWKTLQGYLFNAHMESVKSMAASVTYCKKEGDYLELGEIVLERARTDIHDFKEAIMEGQSDLELLEHFPSQFLTSHRAVHLIRQQIIGKEASSTKRSTAAYYLAGESGLGKTTVVYDAFGFDSVYRVTSYSHPFDSYEGQPVLFLDEFRSGLSYDSILNILDGFPLQLTARFQNRWAQFSTIILSSNWEFSDQYREHFREHPSDKPAFTRRFQHIDFATAATWPKIRNHFSAWAETRQMQH